MELVAERICTGILGGGCKCVHSRKTVVNAPRSGSSSEVNSECSPESADENDEDGEIG